MGHLPGPDKAQNGGVDLKVYTDNNTAYTDLISGNLDLVDDIPAQQLKNVKNDLGDRYINQPALIIQTLTFPLYDPQWSKEGMENVRRGISMAINRDEITKQIFRETRTPAKDWTSPALGEAGGFSSTICGDACVYDPAAAKKLITDAGGLPGGKVTLTSNVDTGSHRDWMDAVCNSINNALGEGPVCTVNPIGTFADFRNQQSSFKLTGPFRSGWQADYPDPELPPAPLLHRGLLQLREVQQRGLRQARRRGQPGERPGQGRRQVPGLREDPRRADAGHPALVPERQRGLRRAALGRGAQPVQRPRVRPDQGQLTHVSDRSWSSPWDVM